jgi:hypothetical protein
MFEINKYMLTKMGWVTYSQSRGIRLGNTLTYIKPTKGPFLESVVFEDDPLVRFFFDDKEKKVCYVVKELSDNEKQKSKNLYKFVALDYTEYGMEDWKPKIEINEISSNEDLFRLVIKNEACNETYQRHFKINKLFK